MNSSLSLTNTQSSLLPDELKMAQEAINFPEVQEMMKNLAKYNLGICMPHLHDEERGAFEILPHDMVQIEEGLQVSFVSRDQANKLKAIPVAWKWIDDGITSMAVCTQTCVPVHLQSGGEDHKAMHSKA